MIPRETLGVAILTVLADGPTPLGRIWRRISDIDAGVTCSDATIRDLLVAFRGEGLVTSTRKGRQTVWTLTGNGAEALEIHRCVS